MPAVAAPMLHGCLSIPLPAPFLIHQEDPPLSYRAWYTSFTTYLSLVELERGTLDDRYKNALLYQHLGTEGIRHFANECAMQHINTDRYDAFSEAVATFFLRPASIPHACLELLWQVQGPTETVAEFVTALCEIAPDCQFLDPGLQEMLAQQMLHGCRSSEARCCMLIPDLSADDYLHILESEEHIAEDSAVFDTAHSSCQVGSSVH